ncbi:hypothetical protein Rhe02_47350 [Rhizocola hellebori]|uniref:Alpha/beta hydrolase n=1 Tax=Rhizocola hellebori TaxID=1392758 RepID=A0A8J3QBK1_9ACTN|nr:hypothetical protein Rhe02_47350 [Rhizocola hellebori]
MLHGTILAPAGSQPKPGIVMLEGAGNRGRQYLMPEAEAYARQGIVTLVYDKRRVGYSLLHRDYSVLADDALAGVRLLRARSDVDPDRLGLWALSEGAFVAPIAANRSTDIRYLITVGAVGTTTAVQTAWAYGTYLEHAGVSGSLPRTLQTTAVRAAIGAGIFPEADFDPMPHWQQVRQPVLAQWGQLDRDSLPAFSSRRLRSALESGGNACHAIRIVAGVNHNLHLTADDGFDRLPTLPNDYSGYEAAWINDPCRTAAGPGVTLAAEPAPPTIPRPGWSDSRWAWLAMLAILFAAYAAYAIIPATIPIPRPAAWAAILAPVTVAGSLVYLVFLLATAAKVTGPLVLGRPLPWLVLQLLAVATTAATIAVVATWRHARKLAAANRIRLGLLTFGAVLTTLWTLQWNLLVP